MDTTVLPQRATDVSDKDIDFVAGAMNDGTVDPNGDHSHQREWDLLREKARHFIVGVRAYTMLHEHKNATSLVETPALAPPAERDRADQAEIERQRASLAVAEREQAEQVL